MCENKSAEGRTSAEDKNKYTAYNWKENFCNFCIFCRRRVVTLLTANAFLLLFRINFSVVILSDKYYSNCVCVSGRVLPMLCRRATQKKRRKNVYLYHRMAHVHEPKHVMLTAISLEFFGSPSFAAATIVLFLFWFWLLFIFIFIFCSCLPKFFFLCRVLLGRCIAFVSLLVTDCLLYALAFFDRHNELLLLPSPLLLLLLPLLLRYEYIHSVA